MKLTPVAASLASIWLASSTAVAHQEDAPRDEPRVRAPTYDPNRHRSEQFLAFELRAGPYLPAVDSEFAGATPFRDIYSNGTSIALGFEVDWQALRIPHFGSLGPGVSWHYFSYEAGSPLENNPEERSRHPSRFLAFPMAAVAVLRIDALSQDLSIPVVPYAKAGLAYGLWFASDAGGTSVTPDGSFGEGAEFGWQAQFGAMLHLNPFAPQSALDMDNATGINHAYLFFEWLISDVDSFDTGLQLGTSTWFAGIALEY